MSIFDRTSDGDVEDELDRVETDVVVDCDIEAAWALVSEPGWWVNDGPLGDHEVSRGNDGLYRVSDPDVGDWLIEKADEDPMDVVAFRWYPLADDELPDEYATRVEISLSEERGGVGIHVEESGLASVSDRRGRGSSGVRGCGRHVGAGPRCGEELSRGPLSF